MNCIPPKNNNHISGIKIAETIKILQEKQTSFVNRDRH
jgi:hypothetical protein